MNEHIITLDKRFWNKVSYSPGCWEWAGVKNKGGYGRVRAGEWRENYAHRVAYFWAHGEPLGEVCVLHRCDNPPCVNPLHLFPGTRGDNAADRVAKGRCARGESQGASVLNPADVASIRKRRRSGATLRAIAAEFGVSRGTIHNVVRGRSWGHI